MEDWSDEEDWCGGRREREPPLPRNLMCENCDRRFVRKTYYIKHVESKVCHQKYKCPQCTAGFGRLYNLTRHIKIVHSKYEKPALVYLCGFCERRFSSEQEVKEHRKEHMSQYENSKEGEFSRAEQAHNSSCELWRLIFPDNVLFRYQAFAYAFQRAHTLLKYKVMRYKRLKFSLVLNIEFVKLSNDGELETMIVAPFRSRMHIITRFDDLQQLLLHIFSAIDTNIEDFVEAGSGWAENDIVNMDMQVMKLRYIHGSACGKHVAVYNRSTVRLTNEGFCTATKNPDCPPSSPPAAALEGGDGNCFFLAVASHFVRGATVSKLEEFIRDRMVTKVSSPVSLDSIAQFEEDNSEKLDLSVNVIYCDEDDDVYPVHVSKRVTAANVILLVLCMTGTDEQQEPIHHYAFVEDHAQLVAPRIKTQAYAVKRSGGRMCFSCMNYISSDSTYFKHIEWCHKTAGQNVHIPQPGEELFYKRKKNKTVVPYVIFFDFEAVNVRPEKPCNCSQAVLDETRRQQSMTDEDHFHEESLARNIAQLKNLSLPQVDLGDNKRKKKGRQPKPRVCQHKSRVLALQEAVSYAYIVVDRFGVVVEERTYAGKDAAKHFLLSVIATEERLLSYIVAGGSAMEMSPEDELDAATATECVFCAEPLSPNDRVRHHDHVSGSYVGMAHSACNLMSREHLRIVAYANNFVGYDQHIILKAFHDLRKEVNHVSGIPLNTEKFKCVRVGNVVFMDSFAFLAESVDKMVGTLLESKHDFPLLKQRKWQDLCRELRIQDGDCAPGRALVQAADIQDGDRAHDRALVQAAGWHYEIPLAATDRQDSRRRWEWPLTGRHVVPAAEQRISAALFRHMSYEARESDSEDEDEDVHVHDDDGAGEAEDLGQHEVPVSKDERVCRELLLRKGVYPYSWATSFDLLRDTTHLPSKEAFYQDLSEENISDQDYEHALVVWDTFKCKNMLQYSLLYNLSDVYLMAEAMINLKYSMMFDFGLDLSDYLSLPHLAKDVMLRTTKVRMELISDLEAIHTLQQGIRGGVSYVATRFASREGLRRVYGEDFSIFYGDMNNLYGHAMCNFRLPLCDFRWLSQDELAAFDPLRDIQEDSEKGYILCVTLRYPEHLHLDHNSMPLAPEVITIDESMLSPYAKNCWRQQHGKDLGKKRYRATKLSATFADRKEYVLHGFNLKFYLEEGLELLEIHSVLTFTQTRFLAPYIKMCTQRRAAAKSKAEANRFKLLSNSLYGKLLESVSKRMDARFNFEESKAVRRFSDPLFKGIKIVNPEFSITFHQKKEIWLRQSFAVGLSILELSKLHMMRTYYRVIRPTFDNKVSLLTSDTDSYLLFIRGATTDEVCLKLSDIFDFSNYPKDHRLFDDSRKNMVGLLKNEMSMAGEVAAFAGIRSKSYSLQTERDAATDVCSLARAKGVCKRYRNKLGFDVFKSCLTDLHTVKVRQRTLLAKDRINRIVETEKVCFSSFDDKRFLMPCGIHSCPYGSKLIQYCNSKNSCFFCDFPQYLP